ncbi:peptidase, partial [Streptomyces tendae]
MRARSHAVLAASVVLALAAGPLAAPAFAAPPAPASRFADQRGPAEEALRAAIAGLPNQYATAALVRVGTPGGDWHGS